MPSIVKNKIIYDKDDWLGGLHPQYTSDLIPSVQQQPIDRSTVSAAKSFNPYRFLGYAAPGYNPQDATNSSEITAVLRSGKITGGKMYAIEAGDLLHEITLGITPSVGNAGVWPHTITPHGHSTAVGDDTVIYTANVSSTATECLFYSWGDATDWDVGRYTFSAFDDDFMTTVPAGTLLSGATLTAGQGKAHPLIVGDDDILYIGDGRNIHAFDGATGADGTFTADVLTVPQGFQITCFSRISNFLVAFAYKESAVSGSDYYLGEARAFFWDYLSLDPTYNISLNDNYVSEAVELQGTIAVFTSGRATDLENNGNRSSKMRVYNGSFFEDVEQFLDTPPVRGGVFVNGDVITWSSGGHAYIYGKPFTEAPTALQKIAKTETGSPSNGLLSFATTDNMIMSTGSGAGGGLQYFSSGTFKADSSVSASVAIPTFAEGEMGQVKSIKVVFARESSNGLKLILDLVDGGGNITNIVTSGDALEDITATNRVVEYNTGSLGTDLPKFYAIKPVIQWSASSGTGAAPIIDRIEIEYESINIESN